MNIFKRYIEWSNDKVCGDSGNFLLFFFLQVLPMFAFFTTLVASIFVTKGVSLVLLVVVPFVWFYLDAKDE